MSVRSFLSARLVSRSQVSSPTAVPHGPHAQPSYAGSSILRSLGVAPGTAGAPFTIPGGVSAGDMVRAADHHGRWSDWVVLP